MTEKEKIHRLNSWIHPSAYKALKEISSLIKISGLGTYAQQDHVTMAILLYAKTLKHKGIKNGDDVRAKLGL